MSTPAATGLAPIVEPTESFSAASTAPNTPTAGVVKDLSGNVRKGKFHNG